MCLFDNVILVLLVGVVGLVFFMLCNFYVIKCYNNVIVYVFVVGYFVDWIIGGGMFVGGWLCEYFFLLWLEVIEF